MIMDKLPSGSWRARVLIGENKYKTFSGKDKKDVQLRAAQFEAERKMDKPELVTVEHLDNASRGGFGSTGTR
mgnify:CR=1 FL=1